MLCEYKKCEKAKVRKDVERALQEKIHRTQYNTINPNN